MLAEKSYSPWKIGKIHKKGKKTSKTNQDSNLQSIAY